MCAGRGHHVAVSGHHVAVSGRHAGRPCTPRGLQMRGRLAVGSAVCDAVTKPRTRSPSRCIAHAPWAHTLAPSCNVGQLGQRTSGVWPIAPKQDMHD